MTNPRRRPGRFLGLALLVTILVTTAGAGLLHGKSPHSEQQCVAWVWSHQAKDASPAPGRLAIEARETVVAQIVDPAVVFTFRVRSVCIRGPPLL